MTCWNKIDWFCPECNDYWMTTENCSPDCDLRCDCECKDAKKHPAFGKCHLCGYDLQMGQDLCCHMVNRSLAV